MLDVCSASSENRDEENEVLNELQPLQEKRINEKGEEQGEIKLKREGGSYFCSTTKDTSQQKKKVSGKAKKEKKTYSFLTILNSPKSKCVFVLTQEIEEFNF